MRLCWKDLYIGRQEVITQDAGKNFMAKSFQLKEEVLKMVIMCVPVEFPNSMQ